MAFESPKVSIVTPTYNRAGFIGEAVESVLAQTMPDWELLIVDDGSTDMTREVLAPYQADPRIHYLYQPNQGQSIARNNALEKARGNYVGFLDSDDLWCADKLERQLELFESHPDVNIVHGDESMIDDQGQEISRENMQRYSGQITLHLLADNSVSITTALVRRVCFDEMGGFQASHGVADDYDLWLRFSARYRFHYEPGIVAAYRVMPDQISSDKRRRFAANEKIIKDFLDQYGSALSPQEKRWGLARFYCRSARYFASIGERRKATREVLKALRNAPFDSVVWRAIYRVLVPHR
jgi:glycosyltransferase involved in cell wall biosynthesis